MDPDGLQSVLTVSVEDGVALLVMGGSHGRGVNLVDERLLTTLDQTLVALAADDTVRGAVLLSADPRTYLAGGDVAAFLRYTDRDEVERAIERGSEVLRRIETWPKPLVAAVDGACLGGGTEVVLAAAQVIATDSTETRFALPEVRLGLLPGLGGTVRLPRRVGLLKALDICVSGRNVYPREALALGIVTQVVGRDALTAAAKRAVVTLAAGRARQGRARQGRAGSREWPHRRPAAHGWQAVLRLPVVLDYVLERTRARALESTHGNYPAVPRVIAVLGAWARGGRHAGQRAATTAFADLLFTPEARNLIRLFLAQSAARKNPWSESAKSVTNVAVVGAGLMGAGVAEVSTAAGMLVRIKDARLELAQAGRDRVAAAFVARVGKGLTEDEALARAGRVAAVADYGELAGADVTIEAVVEDLELKRSVLAAVESVTGEGHLFASNTSAIRIEDLASAAARPEAVIGMHYFSPVPKMPLLEIVVTRRTAEWAVATATALGLRQGKSVIVVLDGPGFYTTRVLSVYLAESLTALREGTDSVQLERVMVRAGFPLGPLAVMDDVGIDTGAKIETVLEGLLEQRGYTLAADGSQVVSASARLVRGGFLGRKAHKGFYLYNEGRRTQQFDARAFLTAGLPLPATAAGRWTDEELRERLLLTFAREAVMCLQDGVLRGPVDGDVGAVLGLGFPPFLGGPFGMLDQLGLPIAVAKLEALAAEHGERLAPPQLLVDMAEGGKSFYPATRSRRP